MNLNESSQPLGTLDLSILEGYFQDNPTARADFIAFFRQSFAKTFDALRVAVREHNFHDIEYFAHRLRGSVGYVGAFKIAGAFQRMEERAPLHNVDEMESLLSEITDYQRDLLLQIH